MRMFDLTIGAEPILIHVPHAGQRLPDTITVDRFNNPTGVDMLYRSIRDIYSDTLGIMLAGRLDASMMLNRMSRMWVDVDRYPDDRETRNRIGMGVIPLRDLNGQPLYRPGQEPDGRERGQRLNQLYRPWHAMLTNTIRMMLDIHNRCILIDLHTHPEQPLPFEQDRTTPRPHIALTTNPNGRRHVILLHRQFTDHGYTVNINATRNDIIPTTISDPRIETIRISIREDLARNRTSRTMITDTIARTLLEDDR